MRLQMLGSRGQVAHETVIPLSPYPTSYWHSGDRFRGHYSLHASPDVAPGRYVVALNLLDERGGLVWEQDSSLVTVEILPRERSFTLPDISHTLDVTFGDRIHLRGYALPRVKIVPGDTIPLTLYLQADGPTDRSYTLFAHLLTADGQLRGQVDLIPGDGTAPTTSWAQGQVIVQEAALPVAPDAGTGTYAIAVGFYDAAYGGRLPVAGAAEHVLSQNRAILPDEVDVGP
jgi:hypothetical protein